MLLIAMAAMSAYALLLSAVLYCIHKDRQVQLSPRWRQRVKSLTYHYDIDVDGRLMLIDSSCKMAGEELNGKFHERYDR